MGNDAGEEELNGMLTWAWNILYTVKEKDLELFSFRYYYISWKCFTNFSPHFEKYKIIESP